MVIITISVTGDHESEFKRERERAIILTNQIEGLTLAIIIVLEFPPRESCSSFFFWQNNILRKYRKGNKTED